VSGQLIGQFVAVRGRFHRSVNVARDQGSASSLKGYLATPSVRELALRIAESFREPGGSRAWSITGPFGSGKSAFGVFLADALCRDRPTHPGAVRIRRAARLGASHLLPVVAVGRRARLAPALLGSLAEATDACDPRLAAMIRASRDPDAAEVLRLFEEARDRAVGAGFAGLLVLVDELGKFLEHAALHPSEDDLFVLQYLAEGAARSPGSLLLVTIQHSAFADYLRSATPVQAAEWQKVQGRFADVAFYLPPEQMLQLLGASLATRWPADLDAAYRRVLGRALDSSVLAESAKRLSLRDLLPPCVPFDPIVALLLWPLFRSKMAQNERSLFAFLGSREPFGLQEFLETEEWAGGDPPLYRVDRLHDYVVSAIGSAALLGDRARQWAEAEQALARLPADAPAFAAPVVKAVALVGLYGPSVGIRPDRQTIELALGGGPAVGEAIDYLVEKSILVPRRHRGDFAIWEGSDLDLDACFGDAVRRLAGAGPVEQLERIVRPRPWVARAHYIETGTLRHFDVRLADGDPDGLPGELARIAADSQADGTVVFVIGGRPGDRQRLLDLALEVTAAGDPKLGPQVVAVPKPMEGLAESALELEAWQWVRDNEPALVHDRVARDEVRARVSAARELLERRLGRVLGLPGFPFEATASDWIHGGDLQPPRTSREFTRWLSALCDRAFDRAPLLRNELLNRTQLSSSAAKARRNLLDAMLEHEHTQRLGFAGSPPEATMYESLLLAGGFHRQQSGGWTFGRPDGDWRHVWSEIEAFLAETSGGPRPVDELVARLRRPPFGLRDGPIPVVLLAALLAARDEVALYEQGTFLPDPRIEAVERLLRKPSDFWLRRFRLDDSTRRVLADLRSVVLRGQPDVHHGDRLVSVVRPLVAIAARLTPYARATRRFDDPTVVAIREALLRATDPFALVFEDLPRAVGVSIGEPGGTEMLAQQLGAAVDALERAYPTLLDEVEAAVRQALGLAGVGAAVAEELRARAEPLKDYSADVRLTAFVREATRRTSDWREGIGRVVLDGQPPSHWRDLDVVTFRTRLQLLAAGFIRLEELAREHRRSPGAIVVRVDILNGRFEEVRALLTVAPEAESDVSAIDEAIGKALGPAGVDVDRRGVRLAALARAIAREAAAVEEGTAR
jgi:hypothetical protein